MAPPSLPVGVVYAGRDILGTLPLAESRETLLTNGIGGYSSHTLAGSLTRSYHGLLVAALRPPLDRTLLLANLEARAVYLGDVIPLATHSRPHGTGYRFIESFRLEGTVPVFCYAFGDALLEKRVWMKHGQNTVYVQYCLKRAVHALELVLDAMVNHRNHHARTVANRPHFNYSANVGRDGRSVNVLFTTHDRQETSLCMRVSRGSAEIRNEWVTGFELKEERDRGLPDVDDNLHAASFVIDLHPGGTVTFVASAESDTTSLSLDGEAELIMRHAYEKSLLQKFTMAREITLERRMEMEERAGRIRLLDIEREGDTDSVGGLWRSSAVEGCIRQLVLAADQFIITRGGGRSVVAGFHWFTDWARDVSWNAFIVTAPTSA